MTIVLTILQKHMLNASWYWYFNVHLGPWFVKIVNIQKNINDKFLEENYDIPVPIDLIIQLRYLDNLNLPFSTKLFLGL